MEKETQSLDTALLKELARTCACTNIRKTARVITQFYDELLQPGGLRVTQAILLVAVALSEQETVMHLAEKLAMDRSALARSLKPLEELGLLTVEPGNDRRTRLVRLTAEGQQALVRMLPYWRQAQAQLDERFGSQMMQTFLANLRRIGASDLSTERLG